MWSSTSVGDSLCCTGTMGGNGEWTIGLLRDRTQPAVIAPSLVSASQSNGAVPGRLLDSLDEHRPASPAIRVAGRPNEANAISLTPRRLQANPPSKQMPTSPDLLEVALEVVLRGRNAFYTCGGIYLVPKSEMHTLLHGRTRPWTSYRPRQSYPHGSHPQLVLHCGQPSFQVLHPPPKGYNHSLCKLLVWACA